MVDTNWTSPKRMVAIFFFLVALGLLAISLLTALGMGAQASKTVDCTPEQTANGVTDCGTSASGFLAGGMIGGVSTAMCCGPLIVISFILGAFFWSGAKKDDLRDLEIDAYHKGKKVDKKTEAI